MTIHRSWTLDTLVEAFQQHERRTRGLRDRTLRGYARLVRLFARSAFGDDPVDPSRLCSADVIGFVAAMMDRYSPRSMKTVRSALRSFFRFLRVHGLCAQQLDLAIPLVASWRLSALPRGLSERQLKQVLTSFDTSVRCGFRDRAIVMCLSTLGLRPQELADLRLEDIDWRDGTMQLRSRKTRRGAALPLPREAGGAIVDYLRQERPQTHERRVFVQHSGPRRGEPISGHTLSAAAARVLQRAGVDAPLQGAYVFRHTVASRMVQQGTSLKEVADFLGHRCLDSAMIYAKLDLAALREVALPWPEVAP